MVPSHGSPHGGRTTDGGVSVGQQALWTIYRLAPDSAAYNDAGAARFTPPPDVSALSEAVDILTARHDLLRSRFVDDDGVPVRVVDPRGPRLVVVDVGDVDERAMADRLAAVAAEPYDLAEVGTARFQLLRRGPRDAVLVCGNHHIASDAASQFVLWRDLLTAYRALVRGERPALPALTWTWDDQVARERRALVGESRAGWTEHWRTVGRDAVAGELPPDRARPARPGYRGGTVTIGMSDSLERQVAELAETAGVTPFAVHLATLQVLIRRSGGPQAFLIGCPMTLRRSRPTLDAVGYYVNMVLLRGDVDLAGSGADVMAAAARELRAAAAAAPLPYPFIVRALGRTRDAGPPYRVAITQVDARMSVAMDGSGCAVEHVEAPRLQGQYDLGVEVTRGAGTSSIAFRYDRDLFDESTVREHLATYQRILQAIALDPQAPLGRAAASGDSCDIDRCATVPSGPRGRADAAPAGFPAVQDLSPDRHPGRPPAGTRSATYRQPIGKDG